MGLMAILTRTASQIFVQGVSPIDSHAYLTFAEYIAAFELTLEASSAINSQPLCLRKYDITTDCSYMTTQY